MEITEVRVKLIGNSEDRLQAFCSITFDDCFVIRDLKVIEGSHGPFVAMPSRKLTFHCSDCGFKNHLRSSYCNKCGAALKHGDVERDQEGRSKLYADIAHPINSTCRELIQGCVIEEYQRELERSGSPGYMSRYDEDYAAENHREFREAETSANDERDPCDAVAEEQESEQQEPREQAFVQEAETEPRPPHGLSTDSDPEKESSAAAETTTDNDFGAGIF